MFREPHYEAPSSKPTAHLASPMSCRAAKVKAYTTRVGHGPFPTELQNEMQSLEAPRGLASPWVRSPRMFFVFFGGGGGGAHEVMKFKK